MFWFMYQIFSFMLYFTFRTICPIFDTLTMKIRNITEKCRPQDIVSDFVFFLDVLILDIVYWFIEIKKEQPLSEVTLYNLYKWFGATNTE